MPADPDELLEVPGDELRPVVGDDPGSRFRKFLLGPLQDDLRCRPPSSLPDFPVDDVTAVTVQDAAQVVERPADVDVGNIHVPVLVRLQRLVKAGALLRRLALPLREQSGLVEHALDAGRADGHNVGVQHHERQPPVAFQRILQMELDDGFFLPRLQPVVAGNPTVVFVDPPVSLRQS